MDLIFGYKQSGPAAVEACNVFHPYFYEENVRILFLVVVVVVVEVVVVVDDVDVYLHAFVLVCM